MRTFLNGLYKASGLAAAMFMAGIGLAVLAQVFGRMLGMTVDATELSGFFMAAATFLGLAYTFRDGGHIRIGLLVTRLEGRARKAFELWSCLVGAGLAAYTSVYAVIFAFESHEFNDISPGLLAIPFWIPQAGMAAGLVILTVALLDAAWAVAHGRKAGYERNEDAVLGE
ncbi:TRAP dicarboxylate transporter, DctQ subunit, unknown substrate 5 [plant metagenome]|uniref:Tripartite ATP-independent periplasmic transporters DctQ component domain-containing protein n=1 Tax=plant metagenome TaxID=1297885 RepID=A0A484QMW6_9ZZZZ